MYGLVNKAIQDLVTKKFGAECWKQVMATANIETSRLLATHVYDDKVTYDLVGAVSSVLNICPEATLEGMIRGLENHFGEKIEMECQNRIDSAHFLITFADVSSTATDVAISG